MRTANDTPSVPVCAAQKTVDNWPEVFSIMLNSAYFEIKMITKDIMFYKNIRIRIGRGYM